MSKNKDDGKRSRVLEKKRKRRERRKAGKTPRSMSKSSVNGEVSNKFSRAAWKHNIPSNSVNVFNKHNKSKINFNRDAWQSPTPANRPTVTEPKEVEASQKEHHDG